MSVLMDDGIGIARGRLCVRKVTRSVSSVDGLVRDGCYGTSMFNVLYYASLLVGASSTVLLFRGLHCRVALLPAEKGMVEI